MSVVILGGNECMERQYSNICRKYGCKAKRIREAKRRHCFRMPHNRMGQIIKQGVRYI